LLTPRPGVKLEVRLLSSVRVRIYSVYAQLYSISAGRLRHTQPEDATCRGDKGTTDKRNGQPS